MEHLSDVASTFAEALGIQLEEVMPSPDDECFSLMIDEKIVRIGVSEGDPEMIYIMLTRDRQDDLSDIQLRKMLELNYLGKYTAGGTLFLDVDSNTIGFYITAKLADIDSDSVAALLEISNESFDNILQKVFIS